MRPGRSVLLDLLPRRLRREGVILGQHIREGRFQRGLAVISAFASAMSGAEVAYEHYRGSYGQRIMWTPLALSPALVVTGIWATFDRRAARHVLPIVSLLVIADGAIGFVYHVRGVQRKPGGWKLPVFNIVMGPPLFAPLLFAVSGYLGLLAAFMRRGDDPRPHWLPVLPRLRRRRSLAVRIREGRFQRHMAASTAAAAVFSGFEALYSHYKSNFGQWSQWTPIVIAPLLAAAGLAAVASGRAARALLPAMSLAASVDGAFGTYYHGRGILRRPGGLRKPLYNIVYGPPIFAPLLLAASGFLGLLASLLRRER